MKKKTTAKKRKVEKVVKKEKKEDNEGNSIKSIWKKIMITSFATAFFVVLIMLMAYYFLGEQPNASIIAAVTGAVAASNTMVLFQMSKK